MANRAIKKTSKFNILLTVDEGRRFWMEVETNSSWLGKYESVSWFVYPPNFIERLFGVTWQDKIADREAKLIAQITRKMNARNNSPLKAEIIRWLKGDNNESSN